ncbi:MAG: hypothetical protein HZC43_00150 [Nitrosomonadales bacterium]|nr:hypothetical protein [Nitrosomonadales bacterium]
MPSKGVKMQIFGAVLVSLGAITALLARTIGFELDIFYVAIGIGGVALFVYGILQRKRGSFRKERG